MNFKYIFLSYLFVLKSETFAMKKTFGLRARYFSLIIILLLESL